MSGDIYKNAWGLGRVGLWPYGEAFASERVLSETLVILSAQFRRPYYQALELGRTNALPCEHAPLAAPSC